jgi:CheY-like chemotaxis protein
MSKARILVVDDEPFNLDIVAEYLDEMDFDLVMVESGEGAWAELSQSGKRSFDLVLLDRMMPGMDGIHAAQARSRPTSVLRVHSGDHADCRNLARAGARGPCRRGVSTTSPSPLRAKPCRPSSARPSTTCGCAGSSRPALSITSMPSRRPASRKRPSPSAPSRRRGPWRLSWPFLAPQPETLAMGLSELLVNGVEHGNLGIDFAEKSRLREADCWEERGPAVAWRCRPTATRRCICACMGR